MLLVNIVSNIASAVSVMLPVTTASYCHVLSGARWVSVLRCVCHVVLVARVKQLTRQKLGNRLKIENKEPFLLQLYT